jgi:hypothetical protein
MPSILDPSRPSREGELLVAGVRPARSAGLALVLLLALSRLAMAGICFVPGTHPTLQAAIDDAACSEIQLAAQVYEESVLIERSLALAGPGGGGAIVEGRLRARGAGVVVTVTDVAVENGCQPEAMNAGTGAEIDGLNFEVASSSSAPCPLMLIFADGFESGDTAAWDSTIP